MKNMKQFACMVGLCLSVSGWAAASNPSLDCNVAAMKDTALFPGQRELDVYLKSTGTASPAFFHATADAVVQLCSGATNGSAPIACAKAAATDPTVFTLTKAYDAANTDKGSLAEMSAAKLCRKATDPTRAISCYKAVMSDPTQLVDAKAVDVVSPPLPNTHPKSEAESAAISLCGAN